MIANKMESNGIEGKVVISESTKALLEMQAVPQFNFNFHKEIKFPNRNLDSFWIEEIL